MTLKNHGCLNKQYIQINLSEKYVEHYTMTKSIKWKLTGVITETPTRTTTHTTYPTPPHRTKPPLFQLSTYVKEPEVHKQWWL